MYLNGVNVANGAGPNRYPNSQLRAEGLKIGCAEDGWQVVNGAVDEVSLFNYPLSQVEIMAEDADGDGLDNGTEWQIGSNPIKTDSDQDGMPDGWEHAYGLNLLVDDASSDWDQDSLSNLAEYQAGSSPTDYYNGSLPTLTAISGDNQAGAGGLVLGEPFTVRVTTAAGAPLPNAPLTFSAGDGVLLGDSPSTCAEPVLAVRTDTEGLARVYALMPWVYGASFAIEATATSGNQNHQITLQATTASSVITVTDPPAGTLARPLAQLRGYAPLKAAQVTCELINANGTTTRGGFITGFGYDTTQDLLNRSDFQCFDLVLAPGANEIRLYVTDATGQMHTWSGVWQFDPSAPNDITTTITWPPHNTAVAGSSFTLRGKTADPSASVSVTIPGSNPITLQAVVERDGTFWADAVPIPAAPGAVSQYVLTVQDAGGRSTSVNFDIGRGTANVFLDPIDPEQLRGDSTTVSGLFGADGYRIYVNGVACPWDTSQIHSWTVENVALTGTDYVTLQVRAVPMDAVIDPGNVNSMGNPNVPGALDMEFTLDRPPEIVVSKLVYYNYHDHTQGSGQDIYSGTTTWRMDWGVNAINSARYTETINNLGVTTSHAAEATWQGNQTGTAPQYDEDWEFHQDVAVQVPDLVWLHADRTASWDEERGGVVKSHSLEQRSQTFVELRTHGRAVPNARSLFRIAGSATQIFPHVSVNPLVLPSDWCAYFDSPTTWFSLGAAERENSPYWPLLALGHEDLASAHDKSAVAPQNIGIPIAGRVLSQQGDCFVELPSGVALNITPTVAPTPENPADYYIFNLEAWRATSDLDNDSLNLLPADTGPTTLYGAAESLNADLVEDIEGDPAHPGNIVFVNNGDEDEDGVPNFADGFATDGTAENGAGGFFSPMPLTLPNYRVDGVAFCQLDLNVARIRFKYTGSDPKAAYWTVDENEGIFWHPGEGQLRVWKQNGTASRNSIGASEGGDYIEPNLVYTPAQLGFHPQNPRPWSITLYVEAVSVSTGAGDRAVTVEIDPDGPGAQDWVVADRVRFTVLEHSLVTAVGDISADKSGFRMSHSSPVISATATVQNVRSSADGSHIVGDLQIVGDVTSALCEIIPGSDAVISTVHIYLNNYEEELVEGGLPIIGVKTDNARESLLRPHSCPGAFSLNLQEVVLDTGTNMIRLVASDPFTGITGFTELTCQIDANSRYTLPGTPPTSYTEVTAALDFGGVTSVAEITETTPVTLTVNNLVAGSQYSGVVFKTSDSPLAFKNNDAWVTFKDAAALDSFLFGTDQAVEAILSSPTHAAPSVLFNFRPSSSSSSVLVSEHIALSLSFGAVLDEFNPDTVTASILRAGGTAETAVLTETGADTKVFANAASDFVVTLPPDTIWDGNGLRTFQATVFHTGLGLSDYGLVVTESADTPMSFATDNELVLESLVDGGGNRNFNFASSTPKKQYASEGGELHVQYLRVDGPQNVLAVQAAKPNSGMVKGPGADPHYYRCEPGTTRPTPIIASHASSASGASAVWKSVGNSATFYAGFLKGFGKGGYKMVKGTIVGVGKAIGYAGAWLYIFTAGSPAEQVAMYQQSALFYQGTYQTLSTLVNFVSEVGNSGVEGSFLWCMGQNEECNKVSEPVRLACEISGELIEALWEEYRDLGPGQQGEVFGEVMFELVNLAIPEAKLTQAGKIGVLMQLRQIAVAKNNSTLVAAIDKTIAGLQDIANWNRAKGRLVGNMVNKARGKRTPRTPWQAAKEVNAANKTASAEHRGYMFSKATKRGVDEVAAGRQPLFDPVSGEMTIPSIAESSALYEEVTGCKGVAQRLSKGGTQYAGSFYDNHHLVLRDMIEVLLGNKGGPNRLKSGITSDSAPSLLSPWDEHKAIHEVIGPLWKQLQDSKPIGQISVDDVIDILKRGYESGALSRPNEAKVAEMWLNHVRK